MIKLLFQSLVKSTLPSLLMYIFCILELVGHRHGETSIEDFIFFPAFFGFISCIVIFKLGVSLRAFLMKDEDYYDK